jgi:hypothetical protein
LVPGDEKEANEQYENDGRKIFDDEAPVNIDSHARMVSVLFQTKPCLRGERSGLVIKKAQKTSMNGEYSGLDVYQGKYFYFGYKNGYLTVKTLKNGNKCSAVFANWNLIQL